ncbi:MAG: putative baseplate assembly protein [Desulfobulbaceae bacterium A2]|nr:MAG: putative baseplate assembly protein [Desulfobulbaceae bacterium A2]
MHELTPAAQTAILRCLVPHNGLRLLLVDIQDTTARLTLYWYNHNFLDELLAATAADPALARRLFPLRGGRRLPAGEATGQVQVQAVQPPAVPDPAQPSLILTVRPIGDYSTYTLSLNPEELPGLDIDPLFSEIDFKFRPGCFSIECAPQWQAAPPPGEQPVIDYLAKDYHSFKHSLISAMAQRVPDWQPTSEADLDQVLLELCAAAADELSDFQDRVMNEAFLGTARKRVSCARHARLMDYHIHQGNQAVTWLAVTLHDDLRLHLPRPAADPEDEPARLQVWAGHPHAAHPEAVVFLSRDECTLHALCNRLALYTWDGAIPALAAGCTRADLQPLAPDNCPIADHDRIVQLTEWIRQGLVPRLLLQEWLNPASGRPAGRNPGKRQLVRLRPGDQGAEARHDPVSGAWFVRVHWLDDDALQARYCCAIDCPAGGQTQVSLFHGNLLPVCHGRPQLTVFRDPAAALSGEDAHYQRSERRGTLCPLPVGPLAYRESPPGGETPPRSTLEVEVLSGGGADPWDEVSSLIHSDDSDEGGDHFMVETDELGRSQLRFGNGVNGRRLPEGATVSCRYQVGAGMDGNIGADTLTHFDALAFPEISACWNPFDVTGGRAAETRDDILRRVPEAYCQRQLRAVTLRDYEQRAEELPDVARAAAHYAWTGSWRTVQLAIDPAGGTTLTPALRRRIATQLEAVRLLGEDLEIRPPRFVALDIRISLCIHPDYWIDDIRFLLEQELSEGYTPDGRRAFFHPDRWSFGQPLHASEITARLQGIEGVDHIQKIEMKRWHDSGPATDALIEVRPNEILRVRNDPDHMEDGCVTLTIGGGRP